MLKTRKQKKNNNGNTFIVVIVTIAAMSILVGVILATMGYFYRTRMVDLNSKNNFYYVEKAMDDIYTGVGSRSTNALIMAYEETVSQMVTYDLTEKKYVTMNETDANALMKQKFLTKLASGDFLLADATPASPSDPALTPNERLQKMLQSFVTVDGVVVDNSQEPHLYMETIQNSTTNRYEKIVIHNITVKYTNDQGYVQSITTDIEINEPKFDVSFSSVSSKTNPVYNYATISDMGLQFINPNTTDMNISITGNVYAAADFYNKSYNKADASGKAYDRVNSYSEETTKKMDGVAGTSKYSGIYAQGTKLAITADTVIVPGTIAIIDDSKVRISGNIGSGNYYTDVWADNIVLSSALSYEENPADSVRSNHSDGKLEMYANAYISDDMEINSNNAVVTLNGSYYGYNYGQFSETEAQKRYVLSEGAMSKAHVNSSSIIVNGKDATLDLTSTKKLYVAGRAYISTTTIQNTETKEGTVTVTYITPEGEEVDKNEDVMTGESISVRSNQLAYIPYGLTTADETTAKKVLPKFSEVYPEFNAVMYNYMTNKGWLVADEPYVKNQVYGMTYYFLNFTSPEAAAEYFEWYANGLSSLTGYATATDIQNITQYKEFNVKTIDYCTDADASIETGGAYSSGILDGTATNSLTVTGATLSSGAAAYSTNANLYNSQYLSYKYSLSDTTSYKDSWNEMVAGMLGSTNAQVAADGNTLKDTVKGEDGTPRYTDSWTLAGSGLGMADITPINYYFNMDVVDKRTWSRTWATGRPLGEAYVWVSKTEKLTVSAPSGTSGKLKGIIIAEGDVEFDSSVSRFEGMIVSGGKVISNHSMDFVANPELVKTVLRTADSTKGAEGDGDSSALCSIFQDYTSETQSATTNTIGNIEVGDILQYANWKKNVK